MVSQERTSAVYSDIGPPLPKSLLKTWPPTLVAAGQSYVPFSGNPALMAAVSVVTFQVEPGGYSPWVARVTTVTVPELPNSALNSRVLMPPVQTLGSYVG